MQDEVERDGPPSEQFTFIPPVDDLFIDETVFEVIIVPPFEDSFEARDCKSDEGSFRHQASGKNQAPPEQRDGEREGSSSMTSFWESLRMFKFGRYFRRRSAPNWEEDIVAGSFWRIR